MYYTDLYENGSFTSDLALSFMGFTQGFMLNKDNHRLVIKLHLIYSYTPPSSAVLYFTQPLTPENFLQQKHISILVQSEFLEPQENKGSWLASKDFISRFYSCVLL